MLGFGMNVAEHVCARVGNEWICASASVEKLFTVAAFFLHALPSGKGCNSPERVVMGEQQEEACMKHALEGGMEALKCCFGLSLSF